MFSGSVSYLVDQATDPTSSNMSNGLLISHCLLFYFRSDQFDTHNMVIQECFYQQVVYHDGVTQQVFILTALIVLISCTVLWPACIS